jgi:tetratricopeptide (TPR) repeat protein
MNKYDEYINKGDLNAATHHLEFWEKELINSKNTFDKRNLFSICNELVGIYRQTNNKDKAYDISKLLLKLASELELDNTITLATMYTNIATSYKVFNDFDLAINYYKAALHIYEKCEFDKNTYKYASLLNNYALALLDIKDYKTANDYFYNAIDILTNIKNCDIEIAMTYLNIATLKELELGLMDAEKEIDILLDKAKAILEDKTLEHNSYYAYSCNKAASVFSYYGYFLYAKELKERSDEIYARARSL